MEKNNVQDGIIKHDKGSFKVDGSQLEAESMINVQSPHFIKGGVVGGFQQARDVILRNIQRSVNYKPQKTGFKLDALAGTIEVGHLIVGDGGITGTGATTTLTSRARAYQTGSIAYDTSVEPQVVQYGSEVFDGDGEYNTSTYRFTATTAGYYLVIIAAKVDPTADQDRIFFAIQKGSSTEIASHIHYSSGSAIQSVRLTDIVSLAAGEFVYATIDTNSATALTVLGGSPDTFMSIHRLS